MKKQSLLLLAVLFFGPIMMSLAQEEMSIKKVEQLKSDKWELKKGEFHIGVQDMSVTFYSGRTYMSISPRVGYMISNNDMLFAAFSMSKLTGEKLYSLEGSLNYRRYFGKSAFKPFAQIGAGYGYFHYPSTTYSVSKDENYFHANAGIGVSYRYRRWSFETGVQLIYNKDNFGNYVIKPMVGVSFAL